MGLLEQLWDDTVAGPRPESGLGKLRKHSTFSGRPSSGSKGMLWPFYSTACHGGHLIELDKLRLKTLIITQSWNIEYSI